MLRSVRSLVQYLVDELDFTADYRAHRRAQKLKALDVTDPVIVSDPELGEFRLERDIGWYRQTRRLAGRDVEIMLLIDRPPDDDPQPVLATARGFLADGEQWVPRMIEFAVAGTFDIACDWTDDDAVPLTREAYAARLTLSSLTFYAGGMFSGHFDNDGIFGEHDVEVTGTLAEGLQHAAM